MNLAVRRIFGWFLVVLVCCLILIRSVRAKFVDLSVCLVFDLVFGMCLGFCTI